MKKRKIMYLIVILSLLCRECAGSPLKQPLSAHHDSRLRRDFSGSDGYTQINSESIGTNTNKPISFQTNVHCSDKQENKIDELMDETTKEQQTNMDRVLKIYNSLTSIIGKQAKPSLEDPKDYNYEEQDTCELNAFPPKPKTQCCGVDSLVTNYINGGTETKLRQFPWLVTIEYEDETGESVYSCGGSLISGQYVLTAGHCIEPDLKPVAVHLGDHYINHQGKDCVTEQGQEECNDGDLRVEIESTDVFKGADIALIRLTQTVQFTDFIRPICLLPFDINMRRENTTLFVAGWGRTEGQVDLPKLNNVKKHIAVSLKRCGSNGIVCTFDERKSTCDGDSGGPLMWEDDGRHYLVGVVSRGPVVEDCSPDNVFPTIYTNVYKYRTWIMDNIRD